MHKKNQKGTVVSVFLLILFSVANTAPGADIQGDALNAAPTKAASAVETQLSPDRIWNEISNMKAEAYREENRAFEYWVLPDKFRTFSLDKAALDEVLGDAPQEVLGLSVKSRPKLALIYLPTPKGQYMAFEFAESPIMAAGLAEKFPEIKTYAGTSVDDSGVKVRFDSTPAGFHAQVLAPGARWYIDPQYKGDTHRYVSYHSSDYHLDKDLPQCMFEGKDTEGASSMFPQRSGDILREYRLAVATTGEYSQFHGGTAARTLAAVTTTINRVTGIYEREMAIRLTLVANNDLIIYTDPNSDPFNGNFNPFQLINESQTVINNEIGAANYDIGHTFSTGAGGLAGLGVVCLDSQKARGVTGTGRPVGDPFDVDYVAHEMGHQFGGNHTFNGANGSCSGGNRNGSTAYEPGSGSTIQAYAGICGANNLQSNSDPIFHSVSHTEILNYVGGAGTCGTTMSLSNAIPNADAGSDYTIPVQTPFVLTGSSSDADAGDTLTYLWEERDLGPQADLNAADDGRIPLYRVYTPSASPSRFLPRLATLANNITDNAEKLPQLVRTMDWRLTVRDNEGGVDADDMQVVVDQNSGPFQITSPNGGEDLSGIINITWNVANTNNAPVSAANVDIFLSTDGGLTFDLTDPLVSRTANDGSHSVAVPNISSTTARIMVKGSDNIFFDISDQNFSISPDDTPVPAVTSPVPGSALTESTVTFQWTANGAPVTQWWLYLGSSQGDDDLHDSGSLGRNLSTTVTGLPTDGSIIFARLWYRIASVWQHIDVQYIAASAVEPPAMTSPVPGSSLADSTVTFVWTANGAAVTEWWLYIGTSPGAKDIYDSGSLGSATSDTVSGLPDNGSLIYVRLFFMIGGDWQNDDFQYTALDTVAAAEVIGTYDNGIWYQDVVTTIRTQMTADVTMGDIAAGDFTGDGKADIVSIWSSGLWYQDGATLAWTKIPGGAPNNVTAGDVTGDDRFEIIGTWNSGIWYWDVAEYSWTQMTSAFTDGDIAAGDFSGDGKADVASIWPGGLWYQDGDTFAWTKIPGDAPDNVTAGDVTGDGRSEIIGTWETGIWYWDVAEYSWTQMTSAFTDGDIAAGDFTGDGKADVASSWANGLWYQDGATLTWTKIGNLPPMRVTAGDITGQ
ncbi:MAG: reprolysin-like metallopeptidase [Desulfobacterales bacterium]